jgi:hypothetical protein
MNTQAEGKYRAAQQKLAAKPDDLATLKEFAEAARAFDKRDDGVSALKTAYLKRPTPELYAELRTFCTYPEFQSIKPPAESAAPKVQAGTGAEILPRKAFPLLLDQVILYPVQDGMSVFILLTSTVAMTVGALFAYAYGGLGIMAAVIFFGIVFGYLWSVMDASGMGEKRTRGWPDLTNPEEFGSAIGQYYMVLVICFGPSIAFLVLNPLDNVALALIGSLVLAFGGALYYPMALMLAGFTHSAWEALNLPSGIRSIAKMPIDYLICLAFILFSLMVVTFGQFLLGHTFADAPFPVRILVGLMVQALTVYLLTVQMRTVGLLYYAREKDLGWFQ